MLNFRGGGKQFCKMSTKTAENLRQNDRANLHKNPGDLYTRQKNKKRARESPQTFPNPWVGIFLGWKVRRPEPRLFQIAGQGHHGGKHGQRGGLAPQDAGAKANRFGSGFGGHFGLLGGKAALGSGHDGDL